MATPSDSDSRKSQQERIEQLANLLQHDIMISRWQTGVFLRQNELERHLSVNRFTVRQVLEELTKRGVLEHVPYKGHRIKEHSPKEREQITETRLLLEQGACRKVMQNITEEGMELLQQQATTFRDSLLSGDTQSQIESNFLFHKYFYDFCGNPFLAEEIRLLREKGLRVSKPGWHQPMASERACQEHFAMVEALKNKDLLRLEHLIYLHLTGWKRASETEYMPITQN